MAKAKNIRPGERRWARIVRIRDGELLGSPRIAELCSRSTVLAENFPAWLTTAADQWTARHPDQDEGVCMACVWTATGAWGFPDAGRDAFIDVIDKMKDWFLKQAGRHPGGTKPFIAKDFPYKDKTVSIAFIIDKSYEAIESSVIAFLSKHAAESMTPDEEQPPAPKSTQEPVQSPAEYVRSLAAGLPEEYEPRTAALAEASHAFRQELAAQLAPALNARLKAMPHENLEQKKALCDFVAQELEPLGLAVECPKTGLPGKLKATTGHWPGVGRFHFEVYIDGKQKKPAVSDTLPTLRLIDASYSVEMANVSPDASEENWQAAVGPRAGRGRHGRG